MGEALAERDFSTLLFDFAGCGESEGAWKDISLGRHTEDLESVVAWCRLRGYTKLILTGRSFGGSTVLNYASRDSKISAVCTWAAAARLNELFNGFSGYQVTGPPDELVNITGDEGTIHLKKNFFYDLQQHDLLENAASLNHCRLLIIHGSADESVPVEDAHLLFRAASEPKELAIIEGADHRFSNHIEQVWETFFNWLESI